jgi:5-oxoprolinase (ATP-hydrolysing)
VFEVEERVTLTSNTAGGFSAENSVESRNIHAGAITKGITGEDVQILCPLNLVAVKRDLQSAKESGIQSIAIVLLHSYTYVEHERKIGELACQMGFPFVTLSSDIIPMIKIVPRGTSTCVDAYLTPCIQKYLRSFEAGFDEHLRERVNLQFMQSDGGKCESSLS